MCTSTTLSCSRLQTSMLCLTLSMSSGPARGESTLGYIHVYNVCICLGRLISLSLSLSRLSSHALPTQSHYVLIQMCRQIHTHTHTHTHTKSPYSDAMCRLTFCQLNKPQQTPPDAPISNHFVFVKLELLPTDPGPCDRDIQQRR